MDKIKNQQRGSFNGERYLAGGNTWYSVPIKTWVWTDIVTTFYKFGLTEGMRCKLCGTRGTLEHVLSSCNVSLTQGIHRRRHEQVFWELANVPKKEQKKKRRWRKIWNSSTLWEKAVSQGHQLRNTWKKKSILDSATFWENQADFGLRLLFFQTSSPRLTLHFGPNYARWSSW